MTNPISPTSAGGTPPPQNTPTGASAGATRTTGAAAATAANLLDPALGLFSQRQVGGSSSVAKTPAVILNPTQLQIVSDGVHSLADFFSSASLMAAPPPKPGALPTIGTIIAHDDPQLFSGQLREMASSLRQFLKMVQASGSLPTAGRTSFATMADKLVESLGKIPEGALTSLLWMLATDDPNSSEQLGALQRAGQEFPMLQPLVDQCLKSPNSGKGLPQNGQWSFDARDGLRKGLASWLGLQTVSGDNPPDAPLSAEAVSGLFSALSPWLQELGRASTVPANSSIGLFNSLADCFFSLALVPSSSRSIRDFAASFFAAGIGMNSLGTYAAPSIATRFYAFMAISPDPERAGLLIQSQLATLQDHIKASLKPTDSQQFVNFVNAVAQCVTRMQKGEMDPLDESLDGMTAPLMTLMFGEDQLTEEEALNLARGLAANSPNPQQVRYLLDPWFGNLDAQTKDRSGLKK